MSAFTVRPEDDVTPGDPAAMVHSKALDPTVMVHQSDSFDSTSGTKGRYNS